MSLNHLLKAVRDLGLTITPDVGSIAQEYKFITIACALGSYRCFTEDEYKDIDGDNHAAALQAVLLFAMDLIEEETNTRKFINTAFTPQVEQGLEELKRFWTDYSQAVENPKEIVSELEWQLNSGEAQQLRNSQTKTNR